MAPYIKLAALTAPDNDLGSADAGIFGHVEGTIRISLGREARTTEGRRACTVTGNASGR